jgi:hypothetical protein
MGPAVATWIQVFDPEATGSLLPSPALILGYVKACHFAFVSSLLHPALYNHVIGGKSWIIEGEAASLAAMI